MGFTLLSEQRAEQKHGLASAAALAYCVILSAPAESNAQQSINLTAVVRDFQKTHPDFNVVPSIGYGHYAGNLALQLGNGERPVFSGGGFKVVDQWTDAAGNPIAPHLFAAGGVAQVFVDQPTNPPGNATVDTWNSAAGSYGGANRGPAPTFVAGSPMPDIAVPWSLLGTPNVGDLTFTGSSTLTGDIHCDALNLSDTVLIDGQTRILCEGLLFMDTQTIVELLPGATLELYLMAGTSSWNHVEVNMNTEDPNLLTIYNLSANEILIHNHAKVYGRIISPKAPLRLTQHGEFFGTFTGQTINMSNQSGYHHDLAAPTDSCNVDLNDTMGTASGPSNGGITSAATFDEWYRDLLGVNFSVNHNLTLTDDGTGVFEYMTSAFHPIDDQMFGNEGDAHNNYFTLALTVEFRYEGCTGQFFQFAGSDDAWLFVDGGLGIDLGGVIPGTKQHLDVDRLDLVDGQTYKLHFFYAHRNPGAPAFNVRTNIEPLMQAGPPVQTSTVPAD